MNRWFPTPKKGLIERVRSSPLLIIGCAVAALALILTLFFVMGRLWHSESETLKLAAEAWDSGDYEGAAEDYERYIQQNPTGGQSEEARFQLAGIYQFNLKRYDQALAHYTALLEGNPSYARADVIHERLAEVLAELGRSYEAIGEYEKLNPQDQDERRRIRLRIADLYFDQKNYSQALTEYAKVTEGANFDDLSERAYLREATIYHIGRGQYQQALPIYQKLLAETRDEQMRVRALYGIADCYTGLFKFDEAVRTLGEIKDSNEQETIKRRIAQLEQQKREAAEAQGSLKP